MELLLVLIVTDIQSSFLYKRLVKGTSTSVEINDYAILDLNSSILWVVQLVLLTVVIGPLHEF